MVIKIQVFMLGFLFNACIWRLDQGELTDIIFPVILLLLFSLQLYITRNAG